jgi:hypothetical protein
MRKLRLAEFLISCIYKLKIASLKKRVIFGDNNLVEIMQKLSTWKR